MVEVFRTSLDQWRPSPVVALATSADDSQVAAAREDGSLEIWLVSPGSVGWHCQLTIHGHPNSRISSLIWCRTSSAGVPAAGRLFSSSIDGTVSEWDLFDLTQKVALDSIGVSIWQMAAAPASTLQIPAKQASGQNENGHASNKSVDDGDTETSESEYDEDSAKLLKEPIVEDTRVVMACDDGCVRVYSILDSNQLVYHRSMPRVSGRVLSVAWSPDAKMIYSGSSDGFIRCWNANLSRELYRITVGLGGLGSGPELFIWSLLALRCGTLVSADSSGSVQFWDSKHGTLLQAHSCHKGDVRALAVVPSHTRVFSAGSDGQVILYKLSGDTIGSGDEKCELMKKWVYVGYVRAHTHDVKALTVVVPISREDPIPDDKLKRVRGREKPLEFSYNKWAHVGVPMLISAGDDTKLFAYSVKEFTKFSPHDICPVPQRPPIQLAVNKDFTFLLTQESHRLNMFSVRVKNGAISNFNSEASGSLDSSHLVAQVKTKASRKIICSTISSSGAFFAYSDHVKPSLFKLQKREIGNNGWAIIKQKLPPTLPFAHSLVFTFDSSRLMIAGHDRRIYVVDVESLELIHRFTPSRKKIDEETLPSEPPITKMFTSSDGQWLAAINCFGDVYIFNLEIQRQHWFLSRLDGASVTAGGFTPRNSNVLIISTSSNQVYAFDVEAKQLGEWSMRHTFILPRRYQDFPGEVIGLSFPPSSLSTVIIYSARAMCCIDFGMPIDLDEDYDIVNSHDAARKKLHGAQSNGGSKRKRIGHSSETKLSGRKNFEFCAFRDPVLFVGHISKNSLLIIEKSWRQVVRSFDTLPVHKNIYGT